MAPPPPHAPVVPGRVPDVGGGFCRSVGAEGVTDMVSTHQYLAFAAMSLLVIVIPGPSVLFVIGRALAHGRRTALATVLGNVVGSYGLVVAVALGIGSLVERSAAVFVAVKLAGAAYLVLLGVQAFRHRKEMKLGAVMGRREGRRVVICGRWRTVWSSVSPTPRASSSSPPYSPSSWTRRRGISRPRCCCWAWFRSPSVS